AGKIHDKSDPSNAGTKHLNLNQTKTGAMIAPENVVEIPKLSNGKTVWLDTGNSRAGLQHITDGYAVDFAARGKSRDQIPNLIFDALENGKTVGSTGTGKNARSVYETTFNGVTQRVAVGVSENGFVVTAHPF
ncbi:hypothetical protein, partial [Brucella intermedia]|uniref:hypothetical protein n=1 Tax=Brucella intermedia TaxID=94625 RepID=UPI002360814A